MRAQRNRASPGGPTRPVADVAAGVRTIVNVSSNGGEIDLPLGSGTTPPSMRWKPSATPRAWKSSRSAWTSSSNRGHHQDRLRGRDPAASTERLRP
jgi:hypothetical protein